MRVAFAAWVVQSVNICFGKCVRLMLASWNWNRANFQTNLPSKCETLLKVTCRWGIIFSFVMQDLELSLDLKKTYSCGVSASIYPVHTSDTKLRLAFALGCLLFKLMSKNAFLWKAADLRQYCEWHFSRPSRGSRIGRCVQGISRFRLPDNQFIFFFLSA